MCHMLWRREIAFLAMHGGVGKFRVFCVCREKGTNLVDLDQVGSMSTFLSPLAMILHPVVPGDLYRELSEASFFAVGCWRCLGGWA